MTSSYPNGVSSKSTCFLFMATLLCFTSSFFLFNFDSQWSGNEVTVHDTGLTVNVPAPIGFPPVFYRKGSVHGVQLRNYLIKMNFTEGYHWEY